MCLENLERSGISVTSHDLVVGVATHGAFIRFRVSCKRVNGRGAFRRPVKSENRIDAASSEKEESISNRRRNQ